MGIFSFIENIGNALRHATGNKPTDESLKQELDSHKLGTDNLKVTQQNGNVVFEGHVKDRATLEKAILTLGNTQGVSSVNTDAVTFDDQNSEESIFYTVKSGDTLWKIAESQYGKGHGDKNPLIFEANKPMLTSPDKIYPGQVLRIPPLQ